MLEILPPLKVYVKESLGKGLGVFAREFIPAGETVEIAPVRVLSEKQQEHLIQHVDPLAEYDFYWGDKPEASGAIAFGYAGLYNHSECPNVDVFTDEANRTISFVASKDILPEEEICFDYGTDLWFESK